jgi:hypothetical protein
MKISVFWDVSTGWLALMMEAVSTSETSVKFCDATGLKSQRTATFIQGFFQWKIAGIYNLNIKILIAK